MASRPEEREARLVSHGPRLSPALLPEAPLLCTVEQTARLLNISRTAVYSQLRAGSLRSVKVGGRRLIPRHILDKFVEDLLEAS